MHYLVYRTTNLVNGKVYTGAHKTDNLNDGYLGSGNLIKAAIEKHGKCNFRKDILCECQSEEEMYRREKELVFFGKNSYNLKEGGFGGYVKRNPEYSRKNALRGHKEGWFSWKGKHHSSSTKEKMSLLAKGRQSGPKNSQYGTIWITDGVINKKVPKDSILPEGFSKGRTIPLSFNGQDGVFLTRERGFDSC